jgi:hypothetical protein
MENYTSSPIRGAPVAPRFNTKLARNPKESLARSDQSSCIALVSALFNKNT